MGVVYILQWDCDIWDMEMGVVHSLDLFTYL